LSGRSLEYAFAKLYRQSQRRPYAIKTTEAPAYRRYVIQHRRRRALRNLPQAPAGMARIYPTQGVNDGKGVMFVGHRGAIQPSGFLPLLCGVFPLDHLVDVYQNSPLLQALRDPEQLEGKCHRCEFRRICGGSRARAYAVTGNWMAEEPDCIYRPCGDSCDDEPLGRP
jgi:radical SAM protein with 4Fe4S-binding SPASM domain